MAKNENEANDTTDSNNLDLIYEYTQAILKAFDEDTRAINAKLGTIIAFNGVLIRISMDLPDQSENINEISCYTCLIIKIAIYLLLIASIWISITGLKTRPSYSVVSPGELLDNWYAVDSEICKIFIVKGLRETVEGIDRERAEKSNQLNQALVLLAIAVSLYGLGALFSSLMNLINH
ncbi:MAG: hypothetical protein VKJ02_03515 [Snowella sp.]|nr:hypothetical protein [Snowella sp.]